MQQFETYDLICECMEAVTDQVRTIAEWPEKAMSREDAMAAQVIELIEAILNLTMAEKSNCVVLVNQKVSLMRSFIKMSDSMKAAYCRILLGGDS
uniref:Retrotransposon protein n=1 Tax=Cucumis melo TaxID=3656 RepID=A0A9I9E6F9_CUCME